MEDKAEFCCSLCTFAVLEQGLFAGSAGGSAGGAVPREGSAVSPPGAELAEVLNPRLRHSGKAAPQQPPEQSRHLCLHQREIPAGGRTPSPLTLNGDNCPSHPRGASCQEGGSGLVEQAGQGGWHRAGPVEWQPGSLLQPGRQKQSLTRAEPALPFVAGCGARPQCTGPGGLADLIIPVLSCCRLLGCKRDQLAAKRASEKTGSRTATFCELCHCPSQGKWEVSSSQWESEVLLWIQTSPGPFSPSLPGLPEPDSALTLACHPASPSAADPELWPCHVRAGRFVHTASRSWLWQLNDRIRCVCQASLDLPQARSRAAPRVPAVPPSS
ncbi:uncharacterized protein LOC128814568 [Vidua macroura]|uniref:uncharacterized protein LOC128814568 n=1 Tax=Vidua macroura TaxID=187451 RepID=UPI0023A8B76F|nr:uncharacterized protein LOC128814568 [Vidua macroura]